MLRGIVDRLVTGRSNHHRAPAIPQQDRSALLAVAQSDDGHIVISSNNFILPADSERLITVLNARIVTCRSSASGRLRLPTDPRCSPYRGRSRAGRARAGARGSGLGGVPVSAGGAAPGAGAASDAR